MNTELILPVFCELFAKSAVLLLLAALIVRAWRGASAAQRGFVWLAALVALLFLPFTRLGQPHWAVPIERKTRIQLPLPLFPVASSIDIEPATSPVMVAATPRSWALPDWRRILFAVWLGGVATALGYRGLGQWRLGRLQRRSPRLEDPQVQRFAQYVFREYDLPPGVEICVSAECRVPMTWGGWRPAILLPAEALQWPGNRVLAALRHEAGHVQRRDYLGRWLAHLACAFYWPNPLVWMVARALRVAQEQATDDLVLRAGTPPDEYAALLFDTAKAASANGLLTHHAVAMASPSTLEGRVLAIVDERRNRRSVSRPVAAVGLAVVALALALCAVAQLRAAEAAPAPAPEASPAPQIEIETKFIEITSDPAEPAETSGNDPKVFSDPQFQVIIRALSQKKGVDLLSAPRMTTKSKQQAVLEIIRDFSSPTDWEKDPADGSWRPKDSTTKKVGVTMEVTPEIKTDGSIGLRVKPTITEFLGFMDLDSGKIDGTDQTALWGGAGKPSPDAEKPTAAKRLKPIFSERTLEADVTVQSGDTLELPVNKETGGAVSTDKMAPRRRLLVFVSARILNPAKETAAVSQPADRGAENGSAPVIQGTGDVTVKSDAMEKAAQIIIPKFALQDATLRESVDLLMEKVREIAPDPKGIKILIQAPDSDARFSVSLSNIPLSELVKYLANLASLEVQVRDGAIVIGSGAPATPPPAVSGPAITKAREIILPEVNFRDATISEALDSLRMKALEADPEKKGVNLILKPGTTSTARITLLLRNVPLIEALNYVKELAGLELTVEANAFILETPRAKITASETSVDGPVTNADGNVSFRLGSTSVTCAKLRYDAGPRKAECHGQVEIKQGNQTIRGEDVTVIFGEGNQISIQGEHTVEVPAEVAAKKEAADIFVGAYMAMQRAEKLEKEGELHKALVEIQKAVDMLDELAMKDPYWQPQIFAYRKVRVKEALERIKAKQ